MEVKIFTTASCPNCDKLKEYLNEKGIEFNPVSATDPFNRKHLISKLVFSAPYTEVTKAEGETPIGIIGFDKEKLDEVFGA